MQIGTYRFGASPMLDATFMVDDRVPNTLQTGIN